VTPDTTQPEAESAGQVDPGLGTLGSFPTDTLAPRVRQFVEECAASLPTPPDLVALPALVTVGAAIGNARTLRLKAGWDESAALYGATVGDPGTMKSQALAEAAKPLQREESDTRRTWTSDTTVERLGGLLQENPRGLALIRDELSGWVKSLNQYKAPGRGADRQFYLSAWSGVPSNVDRKGVNGGNTRISVPQPFLSVIVCIPLGVLPDLQERRGQQDGFIDRILFAWPEPVPARWVNEVVSTSAIMSYEELIHKLLNLDWPSQPTPKPLLLTPEAQKCFQEWVDSHCQEMEGGTCPPALKNFYAKLKGYCGRLALIHALTTDPAANEVKVESVMAAAAQVDYFKGQAAKVAQRLCRSVGVGTPVEGCKEEIRRRLRGGKKLRKREIQRLTNYDTKIFNGALVALCRPEVEECDGTYSLQGMPTLTSTDIPTTDTTPIAVGGGATHG
jgi:Protein of unknown function (DUF3987)